MAIESEHFGRPWHGQLVHLASRGGTWNRAAELAKSLTKSQGPPVLCLHGVPASSFLYRKVLPALAQLGYQGIAIDFPGLGLAQRPQEFDYSWSGLAEWLVKAVHAAGLTEGFHLVVHDIGGPIGFDLIRRIPEQVKSLTVLNTIVKCAGFTKPILMRGFEYASIGPALLRVMDSPAIILVMRLQGVMSPPSNEELRCYGSLLRLNDSGKAFLKIMQSFQATQEYQDQVLQTLKERKFPAQVIHGKYDTALPPEPYAREAAEALGLSSYFEVPGKHFLQEDCWEAVAQHVHELATTMKDRAPN